MKKYLPWWLKIILKIVLSKIPIDYRVWHRIGLIQHGKMNQSHYAYHVFKKHYLQISPPAEFVVLELGPGNSLCSAQVAKAFGARKSYLVDADDFATRDLKTYKLMNSYLKQQGYKGFKFESIEELLNKTNAEYLTEGINSMKQIPDNSVDMIWSQAVFEHIKSTELLPTLSELKRILKPNGKCSHVIDLKDHLGGRLNHLRFTSAFWESSLVVNAGFYTNRIRFSDMKHFFKEAGFQIDKLSEKCWETLPTKREKLSKEYSNLPESELTVSEFSVILVNQSQRQLLRAKG